jgi:hypothetical protein
MPNDTKPEVKAVIVPIPGAGSVPLRPVSPGEVPPSLVSHAQTPFGSPAATASQFAFQSFVFKF